MSCLNTNSQRRVIWAGSEKPANKYDIWLKLPKSNEQKRYSLWYYSGGAQNDGWDIIGTGSGGGSGSDVSYTSSWTGSNSQKIGTINVDGIEYEVNIPKVEVTSTSEGLETLNSIKIGGVEYKLQVPVKYVDNQLWVYDDGNWTAIEASTDDANHPLSFKRNYNDSSVGEIEYRYAKEQSDLSHTTYQNIPSGGVSIPLGYWVNIRIKTKTRELSGINLEYGNKTYELNYSGNNEYYISDPFQFIKSTVVNLDYVSLIYVYYDKSCGGVYIRLNSRDIELQDTISFSNDTTTTIFYNLNGGCEFGKFEIIDLYGQGQSYLFERNNAEFTFLKNHDYELYGYTKQLESYSISIKCKYGSQDPVYNGYIAGFLYNNETWDETTTLNTNSSVQFGTTLKLYAKSKIDVGGQVYSFDKWEGISQSGKRDHVSANLTVHGAENITAVYKVGISNPQVEITNIDSITESGAKVHFKIISDGGADISQCVLKYRSSQSNDINEIYYRNNVHENTEYSVQMTNLQPGTNYYVWIEVKNTGDYTGISEGRLFKTDQQQVEQHKLTVKRKANSEVSINGTNMTGYTYQNNYDTGTSIKIIIRPNTGYTIQDIAINGTDYTAQTQTDGSVKIDFTMKNNDVNVSYECQKQLRSLTVTFESEAEIPEPWGVEVNQSTVSSFYNSVISKIYTIFKQSGQNTIYNSQVSFNDNKIVVLYSNLDPILYIVRKLNATQVDEYTYEINSIGGTRSSSNPTGGDWSSSDSDYVIDLTGESVQLNITVSVEGVLSLRSFNIIADTL